MVFVLIATGFEEIEALTPVDILRRAAIPVQTVAVTPNCKDSSNVVIGSHQISLCCDMHISQLFQDDICHMPTDLEMLLLPGGMPGTKNLAASKQVKQLITCCNQQQLWLAAICAAPSILGKMGLLAGVNAVCFPGYEQDLAGANLLTDQFVAKDRNIITAKGMGCSIAFSLALVQALQGSKAALDLQNTLQCPY